MKIVDINPNPIRFRRLDGIRGIAAISVMIYHLMPTLPGGLMRHGFLAVDLFFLLSGFVIAYTYETKLAGGWSLSSFVIVRAIRLYPLVIAAVGSIVLLKSAYPAVTVPSLGLIRSALLNAMLLPDISRPLIDGFPVVIPTWSLFFEIIVNIGYAAFLPWINRNTLTIIIVFSGIILAYYTWNVGSLDLLRQYYTTSLARTIFSFSIGVLMFRSLEKMRAITGHIPAIIAYALTLVALAVPELSTYEWLFQLIMIATLFPIILIISIGASCPPAIERIEEMLGELSYPIYLLHMPLAAYTGVMLGWLLPTYLMAPSTVCLTIFIASLAWIYFDRPVGRLLKAALKLRPINTPTKEKLLNNQTAWIDRN